MSTTKHTPGPWISNKIEGKPFFNIRAGEQSVAQVYQNIGSNVLHDQDGEGEANAKIIAAAPGMRDMLETLLNLHDGEQDGGEGITLTDWNEVRALLRETVA